MVNNNASSTPDDPVIQTFLIADVRGYTRFTQEHGDEEAARLAERFASVFRDAVERQGGRMVELRGDEGLAVFSSARRALHSAVDMQETLAAMRNKEPGLALEVGIGLDAGEALPVQGGFRGGALNLASRLCAQAAPGEVLASDVVVHLGRRIDGIEYEQLPARRLKGFDEPVRMTRVRAAGTDSLERNRSRAIRRPLSVDAHLGSLSDGPMVGRDAELSTMHDALDGLEGNRGTFVLVTGEPGAGKSTLVQHMAEEANKREFTVAAGACFEQQQMVPFYPFLDIFAGVQEQGPSTLRQQPDEKWPVLSRLLLGGAGGNTGTSSGGREEQARLLREATDFVRAASETAPLVIIVDDLQWADLASVDLLLHVVRTTHASAVLVVATLRDTDVSKEHPLAQALVELEAARLVLRVPIQPLNIADTRLLISQTVGDTLNLDAVVAIHRGTEGNPFFIREVALNLAEGGQIAGLDTSTILPVPDRVRAIIEQRLSRVGDPLRSMLQSLSVLGHSFLFDDAQRMLHVSEEELEAQLEEAVRNGILQHVSDDFYRFRHTLTQTTLYGDIPPRRRRRLHLAAGEAIEQRAPKQNDDRLDQLAWHFIQADDIERGVPYAVEAGDRARDVYAFGEAERLYRAALDLLREQAATAALPSSAELQAPTLRKLGSVLKTQGRYAAALEVLEQAAQVSAATDDREGERCAIAEIGLVLARQGKVHEALARLEPLLESAGSISEGSATLHNSRAILLYAAGRPAEALQSAERAAHIARSIGNVRLTAEADVHRSEALMVLGRSDEARTTLDRAIPLLERQGASGLIDAFNAMGQICMYTGEFKEGREYHERSLALAERYGDVNAVAVCLLSLGYALFYLGDWNGARGRIREAIGRAEASGHVWLVEYLSVYELPLAVQQGEWTRAEELVMRARSLAERDTDPDLIFLADRQVAEMDLLRGKPEDARHSLELLLEHVHEVRRPLLLLLEGRALLDEGNLEIAEVRTTEAAALSSTRRDRPTFARTLCVRAQIRLRQRRFDEARGLLQAARAAAGAMPYPLLVADIAQTMGDLDLQVGDQHGAETEFREAQAIYERLQARPHLEKLARALSALKIL